MPNDWVLPQAGSWLQTETGRLYDLWVNCSVIALWAGSTWWGGGSLEKELEAPGPSPAGAAPHSTAQANPPAPQDWPPHTPTATPRGRCQRTCLHWLALPIGQITTSSGHCVLPGHEEPEVRSRVRRMGRDGGWELCKVHCSDCVKTQQWKGPLCGGREHPSWRPSG